MKPGSAARKAPCVVCRHPKRLEIDAAFVRGASARGLASQYGFGKSTAAVHRQEHLLGKSMRDAMQRAEDGDADTLYKLVRELQATARRLLEKAENRGNYQAAIAACRELGRHVELLGAIRASAPKTAQPEDVNVVVTFTTKGPQVRKVPALGPAPSTDDAIDAEVVPEDPAPAGDTKASTAKRPEPAPGPPARPSVSPTSAKGGQQRADGGCQHEGGARCDAEDKRNSGSGDKYGPF